MKDSKYREFLENLGFYECSPMPLFRLDLSVDGTYLLTNSVGDVWIEYDEDHGDEFKESVGLGSFKYSRLQELVEILVDGR